MFEHCNSLITLNLSNFNTKNVHSMQVMFYNCCYLYECSSLTSLHLSSFVITSDTNINKIFAGCNNLEYINILNFIGEALNKSESIFKKIPENVIICLKNNENFLKKIKNKKCALNNCSAQYKLIQKKIIKENDACIDNCLYDDKYKYEFNNKCYSTCIINYNNSLLNICNCDLEQCLLCTYDSSIKGLCTQCNKNFYPKENDSFNIGIYIKCYNESIKKEGFYIDKKDNLYKKCYVTCETCEKNGNYSMHNCLTCKSCFSHEFKIKNFSNCYVNYEHYFYFDIILSNYFCTEDNLCQKKYNKLIKDKRQCIEDCTMDAIYKYEFRNECFEKCPFPESKLSKDKAYFCEVVCPEEKPFVLINEQKCTEYCKINEIKNNLCLLKFPKNETIKEAEKEKKEIKAKDKIMESIEKDITSGEYNISNIDNGQAEVLEKDNMKVTLTSTNKNVTRISLNHFESNLRHYYNISKEENLFLKQIEVIQTWMKVQKLNMDNRVIINLIKKVNQNKKETNTLISFGLSFIYPFGIYLFPGFFRIPASSIKKSKRKYLYQISVY